MPLDRATCARKVKYLRTPHSAPSATSIGSRDETFLGLMRLRGMECRAPGGYAEAFYGRENSSWREM